jgi:glutamyl/glutaminyl-tRNA synthetase
MGVTEVVRGDDLLGSTARQLLLYRALGLSAPRFAHVPLVNGEDGTVTGFSCGSGVGRLMRRVRSRR